ncbi:dienelactone hydrolase family protein [Naumannella huperziae]
MSTVLLLHSALGLRPAVGDFADALRGAGHEVITPDFYDGQVFDDTAGGIGYRDQVGGRELFERVRPTLADLPPDTVLAGFSLGAAFAQRLATERPGAAAVILLHYAAAPRGRWPGQPVQVHRYADDSWIAPADVAALGRAVTDSGASFADHVLPGSGHLFTDPATPDGDAAATARTIERITTLLASDGGG